jgi:DNA-binding IclR family transcriptional regulator
VKRGLRVELSPNEETALQRIAQGMMLTKDMESRHLARLKQLGLIEEAGTDFKLTYLGGRRLAMRSTARGTSPSDKPEREVPEPDSLGG